MALVLYSHEFISSESVVHFWNSKHFQFAFGLNVKMKHLLKYFPLKPTILVGLHMYLIHSTFPQSNAENFELEVL